MKDIILNSNGQTEEEFLREYDSSKYKKPSVTVDMLIFKIGEVNRESYFGKEVEVLLIKRGNFPDMNKWAFPGGFINMDENLEESAARELEEETGLKNIPMIQLRAFGDVNRDKRDRIITVSYIAVIENNVKAVAGDDAADAKWFKVNLEENDDKLKINLNNRDLDINLKLKTKDIKFGNNLDKDFKIKFSDCIAGDHGEVLAYGLRKLKTYFE